MMRIGQMEISIMGWRTIEKLMSSREEAVTTLAWNLSGER
jgi:hypothetical protein